MIDIYAYPDARLKKLWFGGGATDVTDVVTPGVHITAGGRRATNQRHVTAARCTAATEHAHAAAR